MATTKVHPARSVAPAATASKSTTLPAKKPVAAKTKTKTSNSPSAAKGLSQKARKSTMLPKPDGSAGGQAFGKAASRLIDQRIRDLGGWRGETLARMRALILGAGPAITEGGEGIGTPVWAHDGVVSTGGAHTK